MSDDISDTPRTTAIEQLQRMGLSAYAARTFVALVGLGSGTAKEVSEVSEVPRTRVYDAVDELHKQGLVDIQQSTPRRFSPVSGETTGHKFEREYEYRVNVLVEALDEIEPIGQREEQRGVWTVYGQDAVTDRVLEFLESAEDEIVYMTVEELLTDELVDALDRAEERGVAIKLGGMSSGVLERIEDDVPNADRFESAWAWEDTPAGRVMMVDNTSTLASTIANHNPSDELSETAIWGSGEANSLVAILRGVFTWRLNGGEYEPSS